LSALLPYFYDRGRLLYVDIHNGKRPLYQLSALLRSETATVRTNPNPNPILKLATVKTTFTFTTALTTGMPLTAVS